MTWQANRDRLAKRAFVRERTTDFAAAREAALASDWLRLEAESGTSVDTMRAFAGLLVARPNTIFVWSMGLTQHAHGVQTIEALINVALARGPYSARQSATACSTDAAGST